jgi:hypothetical protein
MKETDLAFVHDVDALLNRLEKLDCDVSMLNPPQLKLCR